MDPKPSAEKAVDASAAVVLPEGVAPVPSNSLPSNSLEVRLWRIFAYLFVAYNIWDLYVHPWWTRPNRPKASVSPLQRVRASNIDPLHSGKSSL